MGMGPVLHVVVLLALVVNLWVGGDLVEAWAGHLVRAAFEVVLILGYLVLVLGQRAPLPLPWRRRRE